jgi:hypothetical protein
VLAFGVLLYTVPPAMPGWWGLAPEGAARFSEIVPGTVRIEPLPPPVFAWTFRALLVLVWAAWLGTVAFGFRAAPRRDHWLLVAATGIALAFSSPPVLSRDVFGYVAYHRVPLQYGLNPYEHGRAALERLGDPTAAFLVWDTPMPYGPLWPLLAMAVGWAGHFGGLYGEVVAHKLLAAAALLGAAFAGARLADSRETGRGGLSFLAIGLQPLLLLEGPGTGHNDVLMMAPLMWAGALTARGHWRTGAFALGLSAAIKPVTITAVPLLLFERLVVRARGDRWREACWIGAAAAAPSLLLSALFGGPAVVGRAVLARGEAGQTELLRALLPLGVAAAVLFGIWTIRRTAATRPAAWLTAWIPVAIVMIALGTATRFPWYAGWILVPALAGWDEQHRVLNAIACVIGLLLMWMYVASA